jgi:hypothetical protein
MLRMVLWSLPGGDQPMTSAADEPDMFDGCEMDEVAAVVFNKPVQKVYRG